MEFKTSIKIPKSNSNFSYSNSFFSIGSCFSENIGNKLNELKISGNNNPSGTLFNPISIFNHLNFIFNPQIDSNRIVSNAENNFYHLDFHSSYSNSDKNLLFQNIISDLNFQRKAFLSRDILIITLGTAWVHNYNLDKKIVANCHKIPQTNFSKNLLEVNEIVNAFMSIKAYLNHFKKIIFTLSPVRHTKEGLAENQLSKSILRVAINKIIELDERFEYFPAYEIMIDDLRDYRFYADDMIHPTPLTINYIFEKFISCYYSENSIELMNQIKEINKMISHKITTTNQETKKSFYSKIIGKIEKQNLSLYYEKEINELKSNLHD